MIDYDTIVQEWFSRLPLGYALEPYSTSELEVLNEILTERGLFQEEEGEDSETRFHTKTAQFTKGPKEFTKFILDRYSAGATIDGLDKFFASFKSLDAESFQEIGKIIGRGTRREPNGGTFQLGKYELMLKNMINSNVRIEGGHSNQLFLAMIYDGKVIVSSSATGDITVDVQIPGSKGIMLQTSETSKYVDFGNLPQATAELLGKLLELYKIVYETDTGNEFDSAELGALLRELIAPDAVKEFETMVNMSQTSDIGAFQKLSKRVSNILGDSDIRSLVMQFIDGLNSYIQSQLSKISHWAMIPKDSDMIYLESVRDLYEMLNSTKDPIRISRLISSITEYNVRVKGDIISRKIAN